MMYFASNDSIHAPLCYVFATSESSSEWCSVLKTKTSTGDLLWRASKPCKTAALFQTLVKDVYIVHYIVSIDSNVIVKLLLYFG
jgi:hypothetical protein